MKPGRANAEHPRQRVRADAQRSIDTLLTAAADVSTTSGVDAPVRQITGADTGS